MPLTIEERHHLDEATAVVREFKQPSCMGTAVALAMEILSLRRTIAEFTRATTTDDNAHTHTEG